MSDWLSLLRGRCDQIGQTACARELRAQQPDNYPSAELLSRVLKGTYPHRTDRLEALVMGAYGGQTVDCPVLDVIGRDECLGHQSRPFAATNPQRVALYRACRDCRHNSTSQEKPTHA
jgi:hypothetical protein